ncbi:MAG TPA: hypothetical protein VHS76_11990 [Steroidobacteraceae bacterium]|jgi:hypothetical protein|nr:hypothetical protein [Steroidobacteraceae bacterium]
MPSSDPQDAGASMKRLLAGMLLFLAPIMLAWAALEWWAARMPTSHSVKHENLQRLQADIDTLIIGSSNAYWDIAPQLLPGSAFNLANVAQTFYYDDQLLSRALPNLPKLHRVILTVGYLSLFFQLHDSDEDERQYYYFQEWHIPPPRFHEELDLRMWSRVALRTPLITVESFADGLRRARHGAWVPSALDPPVDERGWCPRDPGDPKDLAPSVVETKLKYHQGLMHQANLQANLSYLRHMINVLNARQIELVLVTPPVWQGYASRLDPRYWNQTQTAMQELAQLPNVRYFSYLTAPQFHAEDFLDADHLNRAGAARFTGMLAHTLAAR